MSLTLVSAFNGSWFFSSINKPQPCRLWFQWANVTFLFCSRLFCFVFRVKLCSGTGREWEPLNLLNFKVGFWMLILSSWRHLYSGMLCFCNKRHHKRWKSDMRFQIKTRVDRNHFPMRTWVTALYKIVSQRPSSLSLPDPHVTDPQPCKKGNMDKSIAIAEKPASFRVWSQTNVMTPTFPAPSVSHHLHFASLTYLGSLPRAPIQPTFC